MSCLSLPLLVIYDLGVDSYKLSTVSLDHLHASVNKLLVDNNTVW